MMTCHLHNQSNAQNPRQSCKLLYRLF